MRRLYRVGLGIAMGGGFALAAWVLLPEVQQLAPRDRANLFALALAGGAALGLAPWPRPSAASETIALHGTGAFEEVEARAALLGAGVPFELYRTLGESWTLEFLRTDAPRAAAALGWAYGFHETAPLPEGPCPGCGAEVSGHAHCPECELTLWIWPPWRDHPWAEFFDAYGDAIEPA